MEQHQAMEHLDAALLKAIMAQGSEALIYADRDGKIRAWNVGAERIFGHTVAEALGQSLDIIIPERLRGAHWKGFDIAVNTGETKYANQVMTTKAVHKDESTIYVDLSFCMVYDEQGVIIGSMSIARDCTARFTKEREMKAQLAEFERNAKPQAGA